jgi:hypothetical protein
LLKELSAKTLLPINFSLNVFLLNLHLQVSWILTAASISIPFVGILSQYFRSWHNKATRLLPLSNAKFDSLVAIIRNCKFIIKFQSTIINTSNEILSIFRRSCQSLI